MSRSGEVVTSQFTTGVLMLPRAHRGLAPCELARCIFGCGTISCLVSFAEFREMIIFAGCMGTSQEGCSRVKLCKER